MEHLEGKLKFSNALTLTAASFDFVSSWPRWEGILIVKPSRFRRKIIYPLVMTNIAIENGHSQ